PLEEMEIIEIGATLVAAAAQSSAQALTIDGPDQPQAARP
ncbi:hypothetical protein ACLBVR_30085, partial [Pseudomonas aeruginosa]